MSEFSLKNGDIIKEVKPVLRDGVLNYDLDVAWWITTQDNILHIVIDGIEDNVRSFYSNFKEIAEKRGYDVSDLSSYDGVRPYYKNYRRALLAGASFEELIRA